MTDIDRKRFVTVRGLAQKFREQGEDRSDNTIRRWVAEYAEFFKTTLLGGWLYVEFESALPVLKTIADSIGVGKNRGGFEVRDALAAKHPILSGSETQTETVRVSGGLVGVIEGEKVLVDFTPEAWDRLTELLKGG